MADYYPALSRAVSSLPNNNARARLELYEHARTILFEKLLSHDPHKSPQTIEWERASLEMAIRKVDADSLSVRTHTLYGPTPPSLTVVVNHDCDDIALRRESLTQDRVAPWPV